jgi:hypothetical protein
METGESVGLVQCPCAIEDLYIQFDGRVCRIDARTAAGRLLGGPGVRQASYVPRFPSPAQGEPRADHVGEDHLIAHSLKLVDGAEADTGTLRQVVLEREPCAWSEEDICPVDGIVITEPGEAGPGLRTKLERGCWALTCCPVSRARAMNGMFSCFMVMRNWIVSAEAERSIGPFK